MAEIAASAGASSRDVALVMAEDPRVSPELRQRILDVMDTTGYCALEAVQAQLGRPLQVAIVFHIGLGDGLEANHFYSPVASAIAFASADAGVEVVQGAMLVNDDRELVELPSALRDGTCDAAFLLGAELNAEVVEGLRATGCPIILVDGYSAGDVLDSVVTDNATGARIAVEHLIAAGHRDIALLGTQPDCYPSIRDRRMGYIQAIEAGGLPTHFIDISYVFEEAAAVEALGYLRRHPAVTAIFGANDWTVVAFMRSTCTAGFRIPADLSLIGFDDIDLATLVSPALTTLAVDKALMGRAAFAIMAHRMEVPTADPVRAVVIPSLVERQSVAQPRDRPLR
jgi:DNA-binding LacI/PurR family transcriptional regulator